MSIKNNNNKKGSTNSGHPSKNDSPLDKKLDEIIELLSKSDTNIDQAKEFQQRFHESEKKQVVHNEELKDEEPEIEAPMREEVIGDNNKIELSKIEDYNTLRKDLPDEFNIFLTNNPFESKLLKINSKIERSKRILRLCASAAMILAGFLMVILPAPSFLDKNILGGVTLLTFFGLLFIGFGVYFLISTINRDPMRLSD